MSVENIESMARVRAKSPSSLYHCDRNRYVMVPFCLIGASILALKDEFLAASMAFSHRHESSEELLLSTDADMT